MRFLERFKNMMLSYFSYSTMKKERRLFEDKELQEKYDRVREIFKDRKISI